MTHDSSGNHWTEWRSINSRNMSDVLVYIDDKSNFTNTKDRAYLNLRLTVENLNVSSINTWDGLKDFIMSYCSNGVHYPISGGIGKNVFMSLYRDSSSIYIVHLKDSGDGVTKEIAWTPIDELITVNHRQVKSEIKNYY